MYFLQEDELAVHVILAAAYGLLRDIKRARGMNEAADVCAKSFFYVVRDYRRGTLPQDVVSDKAMMAEIKKLADKLWPITADSKLEDMTTQISQAGEKQYWDQSNRVVNFLKHADRDLDSLLSIDDVNNELLINKCVTAYRDVAPDELGNEALAFSAFQVAQGPATETSRSDFDELVVTLRAVPNEIRLHMCYEVVADMNRDASKTLRARPFIARAPTREDPPPA
jgi:hypothetical protein